MSIQLEQGMTQFRIRGADKAAALVAVKALAKQTAGMGNQIGGKGQERIEQAATLEAALAACRWGTGTDETGDIVNLEFTGEKLRDEDALFSALAPFVVSGSYIEALAEGQPFRWRFEGGVCYSDNGRIAYDKFLYGDGSSPQRVLENIHTLLYGDGPATEWNADTVRAIAAEVAKVVPRPVEGASP